MVHIMSFRIQFLVIALNLEEVGNSFVKFFQIEIHLSYRKMNARQCYFIPLSQAIIDPQCLPKIDQSILMIVKIIVQGRNIVE